MVKGRDPLRASIDLFRLPGFALARRYRCGTDTKEEGGRG